MPLFNPAPTVPDSPFETFTGVLGSEVTTAADVFPVDVTGLVFSYEANSTYAIEVIGAIVTPATSVGVGLQLNLSSAVTDVWFTFYHQLVNNGTLTGGNSVSDDLSASVSSGVPVATAALPVYGSGVLKSGANTGTAQLRIRSEQFGNAVTIKAGTIMRVHKIG